MGWANSEPCQKLYIGSSRETTSKRTNALPFLRIQQSITTAFARRAPRSAPLGQRTDRGRQQQVPRATTIARAGMASAWVAICLILCFSGAQCARAEEATTYSVGDAAGWTYINISSGQPADYPGWAAKYQFFVKDILRFNYEANKQNIYLFPQKEAWDSCDLANGKLLDDGTSGFSEWILPAEAYYNFASGMYCDKGQKFRILVVKDIGTGGIEAPITAPSPSKPARAPVSKAPSMAPSTAPTTEPSLAPALASSPSTWTPTVSPPAMAPAAPPTSASAPATWTQTLILAAAAAVAAATMLQL